ncbi:MAG: hypothetical protein ACR2NW_04090 [Thermodesulfobacteriota bacterium]
MNNLIKTSIFILTVCLPTLAYSQVATQPVQPPWYFYWPSENADNFEYSELGNSSLSGGNSFQRRSNVEVNKKEDQEKGITAPSDPNTSTSVDVEIDTTENNFDTRVPSSSSIIKWVDDKGVVHVTNEPGTIPEKYRDQVVN